MDKNKKKNLFKLCECGIFLALAVALSFLKISLPFGGSVTLLSMLPLALIGYRNGIKWGLLTATIFGILKLLIGLENFQYATSFLAWIAIFFFDYLISYSVVGIAGIFKNKIGKKQNIEFALGTLLGLLLRYVFHCISGYVVWAPLAVEWGELAPGASAWIYSITYNGTYMIPEIILTVIAVFILASIIDFRERKITTVIKSKG